MAQQWRHAPCRPQTQEGHEGENGRKMHVKTRRLGQHICVKKQMLSSPF